MKLPARPRRGSNMKQHRDPALRPYEKIMVVVAAALLMLAATAAAFVAPPHEGPVVVRLVLPTLIQGSN